MTEILRIETGDVLDMMAAFAAEHVRAEREACAKVCEDSGYRTYPGTTNLAKALAGRIRARNETETP